MRFSESWKIAASASFEDIFGGIALLGGARDGGVGGVHQPAQQRLVAHNLDVVLDAGPVGYAVEQAGDVARHRRWFPVPCGGPAPRPG